MGDIDAELGVLEACTEALESLENDDTRQRVIRYLWDRFVCHPPRQKPEEPAALDGGGD